MNDKKNSCKIVELCDTDHFPIPRPIRPQDQQIRRPNPAPIQQMVSATPSKMSSLKASIQNHSNMTKATQQQKHTLRRPSLQQQQQQNQLLPLQRQSKSQQQPQMQQQQRQKQPQKQPQKQEQQSTVKNKKKLGFFWGWRKTQSQPGKSRTVAPAQQRQ